MHPKVAMFLEARDGAYARGDSGIIRAMNAELRRLGVRDDATLANPAGKATKAARAGRTREVTAPAPKPKNTLPRCEHGVVADRCPECNEEVLT